MYDMIVKWIKERELKIKAFKEGWNSSKEKNFIEDIKSAGDISISGKLKWKTPLPH